MIVIAHLPLLAVRQELEAEWQLFVSDEDKILCQLQTGVVFHTPLGILYKPAIITDQVA